MSSPTRPAVVRVQPPKAPYRVVNRVMTWLLGSPRRARGVGQELMLLHLTGRKSGRALDFPVAYRLQPDGRLQVLTSSPWRVNLRGRPDVEVTLLGVRRPATAELVEDPDAVATIYGGRIEEVGYRKAGRRMGIRITVPRSPTHAELVEAVRRESLAVVLFTVQEPGL